MTAGGDGAFGDRSTRVDARRTMTGAGGRGRVLLVVVVLCVVTRVDGAGPPVVTLRVTLRPPSEAGDGVARIVRVRTPDIPARAANADELVPALAPLLDDDATVDAVDVVASRGERGRGAGAPPGPECSLS